MIDQDTYAAAALRRWRRSAGLTVAEAAEELGLSSHMLAYYEAGRYVLPKVVRLAVKALAAGLEPDGPPQHARERWVALVERLLAYGRGTPVVGELLRARDEQGLSDMLAFIRRGPDPSLALTDPALFKSLRQVCTRAQLAGLGTFTVNRSARERRF